MAALATVLGEDITGWLDWRAEGLDEWEPPSESRLLTREEREVLDRLIRLLVAERRGHVVLPTGAAEGYDVKSARSMAIGSGKTEALALQVLGRGMAASPDERDVDDGLADAARDVGRRGSVRRVRDEQDQAGEPPADDTEDMEPR